MEGGDNVRLRRQPDRRRGESEPLDRGLPLLHLRTQLTYLFPLFTCGEAVGHKTPFLLDPLPMVDPIPMVNPIPMVDPLPMVDLFPVVDPIDYEYSILPLTCFPHFVAFDAGL